MDLKDSPYVGPVPFEQQTQKYFFGREKEEIDLYSRTLANTETVLYAESGAGKSSLINAKLIPRLRETCARVIGPCRLVGQATGENPFLTSLLTSIGLNSESQLGNLITSSHEEAGTSEDNKLNYTVLVIDQFEELFTSSTSTWKNRQVFIDSLTTWLEADPNARLLIALREEFVAKLDALAKHFPNRLLSRYRLSQLTILQATRAIESPALLAGCRFESQATTELLRALTTYINSSNELVEEGFVDPIHLQLACRQIWGQIDKLGPITADQVAKYGDVNAAICSFYDDTVQDAAGEGRSSGSIRNAIEDHFISNGNRTFTWPENLKVIPPEALELLQIRKLLKKEPRGDRYWLELPHDRFVRPIIDSNALYRLTYANGKLVDLQIEARAKSWIADKKFQLLSSKEVNRLDRHFALYPDDRQLLSNAASDYYASSRVHVTKKNRNSWLAVFFLLILLWSTLLLKSQLELIFTRNTVEEKATMLKHQALQLKKERALAEYLNVETKSLQSTVNRHLSEKEALIDNQIKHTKELTEGFISKSLVDFQKVLATDAIEASRINPLGNEGLIHGIQAASRPLIEGKTPITEVRNALVQALTPRRMIRALTQHGLPTSPVALSPDGRWIVRVERDQADSKERRRFTLNIQETAKSNGKSYPEYKELTVSTQNDLQSNNPIGATWLDNTHFLIGPGPNYHRGPWWRVYEISTGRPMAIRDGDGHFNYLGNSISIVTETVKENEPNVDPGELKQLALRTSIEYLSRKTNSLAIGALKDRIVLATSDVQSGHFWVASAHPTGTVFLRCTDDGKVKCMLDASKLYKFPPNTIIDRDDLHILECGQNVVLCILYRDAYSVQTAATIVYDFKKQIVKSIIHTHADRISTSRLKSGGVRVRTLDVRKQILRTTEVDVRGHQSRGEMHIDLHAGETNITNPILWGLSQIFLTDAGVMTISSAGRADQRSLVDPTLANVFFTCTSSSKDSFSLERIPWPTSVAMPRDRSKPVVLTISGNPVLVGYDSKKLPDKTIDLALSACEELRGSYEYERVREPCSRLSKIKDRG